VLALVRVYHLIMQFKQKHRNSYQVMSDKEMQYRVTSRLIIDFQIIIQAQNNEEAEYFATDIHLDKWSEVSREWELLDVSRDYFLKSVKSIEQIAPINVSHRE